MRHHAAPRIAAACARQLRRARCASSWACVETPNPNVRKFEQHAAAAQAFLPAAQGRLLGLEGVQDVFVAGGGPGAAPWVAVTRAAGASWEALTPQVQAVLETLKEAAGEEPSPGQAAAEGQDAARTDAAETEAGSHGAMSTEAQIVEVLAHRVRPSVQADGGDVELLRWDAASQEVVLRLRGACRGCPQSAVTLQETILRTLQHFVPEVRTVVAEDTELEADAADPTADLPWSHNGEPDAAAIMALASAGTPFFSTFAGMKVEGAKLRRVRFLSRLELAGRTPEHIFISCPDCKARRTVEDPQDLLRADKGNATGNAAVVICPTCCVLITP